MIVVFYEDNEQFVVRALDGVEQRWREEVKKQHLNIWLKQAADARRLRRQDTLLLVAPETALVRLHHHAAESDQSRRSSAPLRQTR